MVLRHDDPIETFEETDGRHEQRENDVETLFVFLFLTNVVNR